LLENARPRFAPLTTGSRSREGVALVRKLNSLLFGAYQHCGCDCSRSCGRRNQPLRTDWRPDLFRVYNKFGYEFTLRHSTIFKSCPWPLPCNMAPIRPGLTPIATAPPVGTWRIGRLLTWRHSQHRAGYVLAGLGKDSLRLRSPQYEKALALTQQEPEAGKFP